ncbi:MAG: hypothetical protein MAG795_00905 [Candidatus Woesearchaeota archaeon]|nr:hypothetical protein [Candidatus Woesearchaeota archaeon]
MPEPDYSVMNQALTGLAGVISSLGASNTIVSVLRVLNPRIEGMTTYTVEERVADNLFPSDE